MAQVCEDVVSDVENEVRKPSEVGEVVSIQREGADASDEQIALIVGVRSLAGRQFFDLATACTANGPAPQPHHLAIEAPSDMECAGLKAPTRFDLRKRTLIGDDDGANGLTMVGCLAPNMMQSIRDAMTAAGDVSPRPASETSRKRTVATVVEYKRTKKIAPRR